MGIQERCRAIDSYCSVEHIIPLCIQCGSGCWHAIPSYESPVYQFSFHHHWLVRSSTTIESLAGVRDDRH